MRARMLCLAGLLLAGLSLAGCVGRVEVSQLERQFQGTPAATAAKPTLWYVGVGLYGETWSENDVAALADTLRADATGYTVAPAILSNRAGRYPPASLANVEAALQKVGASARPGDVALLYVSTHGAPGLLARDRRGGAPDAVTGRELQEWLAPLGGMPTVVVLSACFSGSLIPGLATENRILFAAARADRTSFGCRAGAEHSLFGRALLDELSAPGVTLHAAFDRTRAAVAEMERQQGIRTPSEPQIAVGRSAGALFDAPTF